MEPIRVAIIGGGMMGCGIAAAAAAAGNSVAVAETAEPVRRNGPERVAALLKELEDNGLAQPGAAEGPPTARWYSWSVWRMPYRVRSWLLRLL